ncbi:MAG: hypothetical protein JJU02_02420 [Cryomorphaceae bacterium]|nr:hypothetical protein [Cryomorphaceae bacterium]
MNEFKNYTFEEVEAFITSAILKLQTEDALFLDPEFDINERSVTHRLGMYLAELFIDEDVDCEYNRVYNDDSDEYIAKNVDLPVVNESMTVFDLEAKTVYPDIIVHKRGITRNVLAIEVKMGWKKSKSEFDLIKAEAYKVRLGYNFSVFLELGPFEKYKLKWIK